MPQLDIFAYPTQIFWVLLALSILYIVLTKYILPDLLFIFRMRAVRSTILFKFYRSDKMYRFRNVPQKLKALNALEDSLEASVSLNKETSRLNAGLSHRFNQHRLGLLSLVKSTFPASFNQSSSMDELFKPEVNPKTGKIYLNGAGPESSYHFAPFLVFFAPTDEFILTISFFFFFMLFYYFVSPAIVSLMIAPQINELASYFTKAVDLRRQNLLLKQAKFRNKKTTYFKLFRVLLLYNTLYTSLVLAAKENLKLSNINEVLSLAKSSNVGLESNSSQLSFLFQHDLHTDHAIDLLDYNNLRLSYFVCEHINEIDDPFTILDEILPE